MRRRIGDAGATGLGNPVPELISGRSTGDEQRENLIRAAAKECYETFGFKQYGYCDAGEEGNEVRLGVEPAYQYEHLKLIIVAREKDCSRFITGRAWGAWGSEIASTMREYGDYKRRSKFVRFIDKWHPRLYAAGDASA
jgi:hypothetical protein